MALRRLGPCSLCRTGRRAAPLTALRADTSAEIVFNYLETPSLHVDVDAVSNNHFDEDGLIGIFTLDAAGPRIPLASTPG